MTTQSLEELCDALQTGIEAKDLASVLSIRDEICSAYPQSSAAAEAHYKAGLQHLLHRRDTQAAADRFAAAVEAKDPFWSPSARISWSLLLHREGRKQKALFELRKVAGIRPLTRHAVVAMIFTERLLLDDADQEGAERSRALRASTLEEVWQAHMSGSGEQESTAAPELGMDLKFLGMQLGLVWMDLARLDDARTCFEAVQKMALEEGSAEDDEESSSTSYLKQAQEALASLG